ncbi:MAG: hypothetical protein IJT73_01920 [Selenomonadaceae bacterium]|nr:hypothetical protein [Selenomonadaceae bacterium]
MLQISFFKKSISLIKNFGYFTPPFETLQSLELKLKKFYGAVKISSVQSFAGFICRK